MRSWMIPYVFGLSAAVWLPKVPPLPYVFVTCLCIGAFLYFTAVKRISIAFLVGAAVSCVVMFWQLGGQLDESFAKQDMWLEGQVIETKVSERSIKYFVEVSSLYRSMHKSISKKSLPEEAIAEELSAKILGHSVRKIQLTDYRKAREPIPVGHLISATVRLKPVHGFSNPAAFDYEFYMLQKGIGATGYIKTLDNTLSPQWCALTCQRDQLLAYLTQRYSALDDKLALIPALVVGIKAFTPAQRLMLAETGTAHLAVISGLHIGFIAGFALLLIRLLSRVSPKAEDYLWWLPVFAAGAYMLLAGAQLPTQRAFIMIAVFVLCARQRLYISLWTRWWIALSLVLTLNPLALHGAGLWLSFGAVAALVWGHTCADRQVSSQSSLLRFVRAQALVFLVMTPLVSLLLGVTSWVSPIANFVAIPLVAVLVFTLFVDLVLSFMGLDWFIVAVEVMVQLFWEWCGLCQTLLKQFASEPVVITPFAYGFIFLGSLLILQPKFMPLKWLGAVLWLPLLFPSLFPSFSGSANVFAKNSVFEAWVFDVGQGTAIAIRSEDQVMIYDTGARYLSGFTPLDHAVKPWLNQQGVKEISMLVVSHNDLDHAGGVKSLLADYSVNRLLSGQHNFLLPEAKRCKAGQHWQMGRLSISVVSGGVGKNDNDKSCVLMVESTNCRFLLTGDISAMKENDLLNHNQIGQVDWLLASHHGSRFSSSQTFLNHLSPKHVIVSSGYLNRFNHPHPDVSARVEVVDAELHRTDRHGAIRLKEQGGVCTVKRWRDLRPRLWSGYSD